jgi:hypothetical protein
MMRFVDPMKELLRFLRLMASDDRGTPSSSRVIGILIFSVLAASVAAITSVLLFKIVVSNDPVIIGHVVTAITKFGWLYMILAATALSLYGINVWKYIAQIRAGEFINPMQMMGGQAQPPAVPSQPTLPIRPPGPLVVPMATVGQGGAVGSKLIPTLGGVPVEPHTDPIPPKLHTPDAGVGSDD